MVDFQQSNLAGSWPTLPLMDIIFMRNVLIYFGIETKKQILNQVRRVLKPDGYHVSYTHLDVYKRQEIYS